MYLIVDFELEKNHELIAKLFDKVISIKKIDKENINLIKIKKALFLSNYYGEQEVLKILNPIINSDSIWRSNAIQILIDYYRAYDVPIQLGKASYCLKKSESFDPLAGRLPSNSISSMNSPTS